MARANIAGRWREVHKYWNAIGPDRKIELVLALASDCACNCRQRLRRLRHAGRHGRTDLSKGKISWLSPVAQALIKAKVGDSVQLRTPSGVEDIAMVAIRYGA
jgi:Transcription elongation factor, GreA/GreB, C-term